MATGDSFGFAAWHHTRVSFKISVCSLCFSACGRVLSALAPSTHRPGNWMHMKEKSNAGVEKLEMLEIHPNSEMFVSLSCSIYVICLFKSTHVVYLSVSVPSGETMSSAMLCVTACLLSQNVTKNALDLEEFIAAIKVSENGGFHKWLYTIHDRDNVGELL